MPGADDVSFAEVIAMLTHLHRGKDRIDRDAWRRRGELIGIFASLTTDHGS